MYKTADKEGVKTLEVLGEARHFNKWIFDTIKPYTKGNILEIGSGLGNISEYFIKNNYTLTLSDVNDQYLNYLNNFYYYNAHGIIKLDLASKSFSHDYPDLKEKYDSVIALNVIEHIKDDHQAIENAKFLLKPSGNLIILVPAFNLFYNKFDINLNHYRRYTRNNLVNKIKYHNLDIIHSQYFNFTGIIGWVLFGGVLRKEIIPKDKLSLYNKYVKYCKKIDHLACKIAGLSTINIARKQS